MHGDGAPVSEGSIPPRDHIKQTTSVQVHCAHIVVVETEAVHTGFAREKEVKTITLEGHTLSMLRILASCSVLKGIINQTIGQAKTPFSISLTVHTSRAGRVVLTSRPLWQTGRSYHPNLYPREASG